MQVQENANEGMRSWHLHPLAECGDSRKLPRSWRGERWFTDGKSCTLTLSKAAHTISEEHRLYSIRGSVAQKQRVTDCDGLYQSGGD
jgi:hypothetical protein